MKKIITLLSLAAIMTGCVTHQKGEDGKPGEPGKSGVENLKTTAEFEILKQEGYGGRATKSNVEINSQDALNALYKELNLGEAPKVDFKKKMAVALFMGQKNSGGFSVTVSSVIVKNGIATVMVKYTEPGPDDMVTSAITNPYCIAVIPKTEKVVFE